MSRWFRHYAGMMRDDKLVRVAIKSKQPIERVLWIWGAILESAAEIDDAGRFDLDSAEVAYFLRVEECNVTDVLEALKEAGRIAENRITKWGNRQFQSDKSAARVAAHRERRKEQNQGDSKPKPSRNGDVTLQKRRSNAPETETETETDISSNQPTNRPSRASAREDGDLDAAPPLDAAARLDGWTDEQIDEALGKVVDEVWFATTPKKRREARAHLIGWLDGWLDCDVDRDIIAPIRAFLDDPKHGGATASLARFDAVVLDRKARAKPKAKPAKTRPAAEEPAEVVQLRDAIRDELGDADSAAWMDPARIEIGPCSVTVICPGAFHAEHVTNHLKPRLAAVANRICRRPIDVRAA